LAHERSCHADVLHIDRGKKFTIAISAAISCKQLADFY